jgi:hypothetical protein
MCGVFVARALAVVALWCAPAAMRAQSGASNDAAPVTRQVNDPVSNRVSHTIGDPVDSPVKGSNEFEVWSSAGGAVPINGSIAPITEWNLGARYGRVLTDAHGPSLLNGRFEYSFDLIPALLVFQQKGGHNATVYGGGFDPFAVKWDFRTRRHITPFFEISGGGLFTTDPVPPLGTAFNFTASVALGAHVMRGRHAVSVDVRWFHISNAHIIHYDPGINAVQVRVGLGLFTHPK